MPPVSSLDLLDSALWIEERDAKLASVPWIQVGDASRLPPFHGYLNMCAHKGNVINALVDDEIVGKTWFGSYDLL